MLPPTSTVLAVPPYPLAAAALGDALAGAGLCVGLSGASVSAGFFLVPALQHGLLRNRPRCSTCCTSWTRRRRKEAAGARRATAYIHPRPHPSTGRCRFLRKNRLRSPASRAFASVVALFPALCRRSSLVAFVLPSIGVWVVVGVVGGSFLGRRLVRNRFSRSSICFGCPLGCIFGGR